MGFLAKALDRRASIGAQVKPAEDPPKDWTFLGGLSESGTGVTLTAEQSLQISAVYACVRNIAEDVAKLPLILYRRIGKGKERAPEHPVYELLRNMPNPEMTAFDMRSTLTGHLGARGNCYAYLDWDNSGQLIEMWPLRPDCMLPYRDLKTGELVYEYVIPSEGVIYNWPKERILHVRGLGSNGIMGFTPTLMQARAQGLAWATEEFGSRFFGNGARPGIIYKHPGQLSDLAYKHLQESTEERHTGLEKSHRIKILEEGMDFETVGTPPNEAQFLETRKFQVTEIARWYRMPPHKIADLERATFSNIEEQSLEYVSDTLLPWLVRWEQAIYATLLLPRERKNYFAEHLLDSMLRGKTLDRYQAYHLALTDGWKNRNEVRETENLNQVDGLDEYLAQLNMAPTGAARDLRPVVVDAAERILRREIQDIQGAAQRFGKKPDWEGFRAWIDEFLAGQPGVVERIMRPVAESLYGSDGKRVAKEFSLRWKALDAEAVQWVANHGFQALNPARVLDADFDTWRVEGIERLTKEFLEEK